MKSNFSKSLILIIIVYLLCGCNSNKIVYETEHLLQNEIEKYIEENKFERICQHINDDFLVCCFNGEDKHGIVSFLNNKETGEIVILENIIESKEPKKLDYIQLQDKNKERFYVGVFLFEDKLINQAEDVVIKFMDNELDKPHKIQITTDKQKAIIIDYESNNMREIKEINILNKEGKKIYTECADEMSN